MKKVLKLNAIFLLTIMLLGIPNVLATEPDPGDVPTNPPTGTAEPYSYNGYSYWINGFKLNIYKIDNSKTESTTETTTEGDTTITTTINTNEDIDKYRNSEPTKVINLPFLAELEPTYQEGKFRNSDALYINLNYNITKEQIEELLEEEIASVTDEIGYIVEMAVEYNFLEIPEELNYQYKFNFSKIVMGMIYNSDNVDLNPEINMLEENEQVIGLLEVFKDGEEVSFDYAPTVEGLGNYGILNFQVLSKSRIGEDAEMDMFDEKTYDYIIMFHNANDINTLIEAVNGLSEIDEEEEAEEIIENVINETPKEEIAKVGNTAATYPLYIYVLSAIGVLVGILVIVSTRLQSKQKQSQQQ